MDMRQLNDTLDVIEGAEVRYWVGGGWGIDLLVGRQTRERHDVDLAIDFPRDDLVLGSLGDRVVPCLSARLQRAVHAGYQAREVDYHDLAQLDTLESR